MARLWWTCCEYIFSTRRLSMTAFDLDGCMINNTPIRNTAILSEVVPKSRRIVIKTRNNFGRIWMNYLCVFTLMSESEVQYVHDELMFNFFNLFNFFTTFLSLQRGFEHDFAGARGPLYWVKKDQLRVHCTHSFKYTLFSPWAPLLAMRK